MAAGMATGLCAYVATGTAVQTSRRADDGYCSRTVRGLCETVSEGHSDVARDDMHIDEAEVVNVIEDSGDSLEFM